MAFVGGAGVGIRIYEYRAGMTHAKVLNIDDLWVILGTTNFDNRSFEHNDEVNAAIRDKEKSALFEKIVEPFAWILERQQ